MVRNQLLKSRPRRRHPIPAGLASKGRIALEALSAGGLTAGALLNRRPSAAAAALLEAPFVDLLTAMCDPSLPLTMHEYEEWGDPSRPQDFEQVGLERVYRSLSWLIWAG